VRGAGQAGPPRAHDRNQGAPDDFSTHTRARTLPQAVNRAADVGAVARELLREFAPSRPVRLLGVRVASFEAGADDSAPQLALPV